MKRKADSSCIISKLQIAAVDGKNAGMRKKMLSYRFESGDSVSMIPYIHIIEIV
jgi:hypothetical protein